MVRAYFLGCVVWNIDLATPGNLEKLLNLQVNNFCVFNDWILLERDFLEKISAVRLQ